MNLVNNADREAEVSIVASPPTTSFFAEPVSETTSVASTKDLLQ